MKRKAVFPGSFDPFTLGHASIVQKAIPLFDEIIIAVGKNSTKQSTFSLDQRIDWIEEVYAGSSQIRVEAFAGLTVDFCLLNECNFILRGLRNPNDFQYESAIAHMNSALKPSIETVFLLCDPSYSAINSSIVREIFKNGGDVSQFIPDKMTIK
jgi:pantetheine-phosphate adenylyltransferase